MFDKPILTLIQIHVDSDNINKQKLLDLLKTIEDHFSDTTEATVVIFDKAYLKTDNNGKQYYPQMQKTIKEVKEILNEYISR